MRQTPPSAQSPLFKSWSRTLTRRDAISLLGGAAGIALVGCGSGGGEADGLNASPSVTPTPTPSVTPSPTPTTGSCTKVAEETNGPFPADGSNTNNGTTANVLNDSRVIRRDIRSDLDGTDTQSGTPMTLTMTVQNVNGSCAVLAGYYVYIWHCSAKGNYSQYSGNNNGGDFSANSFFRGVQVTDSNGQVTFTTIFPGRYSGRATHIHFEVYAPSANVGTSNFAARSQVATSQLAFPASATEGSGSPYTNTTLYPSSAANGTQNSNDNVFSDGTSTEMLTITGNNTDGYVATITLAVSG